MITGMAAREIKTPGRMGWWYHQSRRSVNGKGRAEARLTRKEFETMDGTKSSDIRPGMRVRVVLKKDQPTGRLTEGVVKDLLTKSPAHPHGIKVRLESGAVGRVKEILG